MPFTVEILDSAAAELCDPYWLGNHPQAKLLLTQLKQETRQLMKEDLDLFKRHKAWKETTPSDHVGMQAYREEAREMAAVATKLSEQCAKVQQTFHAIGAAIIPDVLRTHLNTLQVTSDLQESIITRIKEATKQHTNPLDFLITDPVHLDPVSVPQEGTRKYKTDFAVCKAYLDQISEKSVEEVWQDKREIMDLGTRLSNPDMARVYFLSMGLTALDGLMNRTFLQYAGLIEELLQKAKLRSGPEVG